MPACKQGIIAGVVLAFARALGEYGATSMLIGYIPNNTATISTTVYQLWRTNDEYSAFIWVVINMIISAVVLLTVNMMEKEGSSKEGPSMAIDVSVQKRWADFISMYLFIRRSAIVGLLGASGCGKSKTLQSIAGIEKPDRGFCRRGR